MFWAFVSLKAYYKLAPLISSNKNFVSTIADSDIHAFIFYETENGIAGISIIITRHAKNNSCVYVTRELPGWSE